MDSPGPAAPRDRLSVIALISVLSVLAGGCDDTGELALPEHNVAERATCPEPDPLWSDIDLAAFKTIPHLQDLDLTGQVKPAIPATYWELRSAMPFGYSILARSGQACVDASDPQTCRLTLANLHSNAGFSDGCPPLRCVFYLVVNRGNALDMITSRSGVLEFLGTIDRPMEAALLAFAHGYTWNSDEPDKGSLRPVPGGFELLVSRLVSDCDPVIIDRFLLTVTENGAILKQRQQHASVDCGACI